MRVNIKIKIKNILLLLYTEELQKFQDLQNLKLEELKVKLNEINNRISFDDNDNDNESLETPKIGKLQKVIELIEGEKVVEKRKIKQERTEKQKASLIKAREKC